MPPAFYESIAISVGIILGAAFFIGLMLATTGVTKKDPPRRGSGMVEL